MEVFEGNQTIEEIRKRQKFHVKDGSLELGAGRLSQS